LNDHLYNATTVLGVWAVSSLPRITPHLCSDKRSDRIDCGFAAWLAASQLLGVCGTLGAYGDLQFAQRPPLRPARELRWGRWMNWWFGFPVFWSMSEAGRVDSTQRSNNSRSGRMIRRRCCYHKLHCHLHPPLWLIPLAHQRPKSTCHENRREPATLEKV
jgi:hypothetical protein